MTKKAEMDKMAKFVEDELKKIVTEAYFCDVDGSLTFVFKDSKKLRFKKRQLRSPMSFHLRMMSITRKAWPKISTTHWLRIINHYVEISESKHKDSGII